MNDLLINPKFWWAFFTAYKH